MPSPQLKLVLTALRYAGVAILFALCGAWSAQFFRMRGGSDRLICTLPLPFAVLCGLLFIRTVRAILTVPLMVAVWLAAYSAATMVGLQTPNEAYLLPVAVGGLVGGLGIALAASICHRGLLSPRHLLAAALTGCVGALPFGFWLKSYYLHLGGWPDPLQPVRLQYAFAIWQAAVGTCLYAVCTRAKKKALPENPEGGHPL